MSSATELVLQTVDTMAEEIVSFLQQLIQIPSVNPRYPGVSYEDTIGGETKCNELLASSARDGGLEVDLWEVEPRRANLVATLKGVGGGRSLILSGHIDTVSPGDPKNWRGGNPYSGEIENGRLYGLGASDMKAGIAAQFKAAEALRRTGVELRGDLVLESVPGEETGERDIGISSTIARGYLADAAVVTEGTSYPHSLSVSPYSPGMLWMVLECSGKAVHSSARDELIRAGGRGQSVGANAIEKGVYILNCLQRLEQEWGLTKSHPLFKPGHFTIHPGYIVGGPFGCTSPVIVSEYCTIEYLVWYPPQDDVDDVKQEIESFVHGAANLDPWLREHPPRIEWRLHLPPVRVGERHPITETVVEAHGLANGLEPQLHAQSLHGFCAVSDASFMNEEGIPTILYGPGSPLLAHTANEYVQVSEVITATKTYALAAMGWCGVA